MWVAGDIVFFDQDLGRCPNAGVHVRIALAGGGNIAKDVSGWSITLEQIIEKDPSIILIGEAMKDDFISHPNYSGLTAVKEGRVYGIDNNLLDRQGYRNAEGVRALAEIFHPEAFE